jgi:hypothetical protein
MNGSLLEIVNFDSTVKQTRRGAAPPLMMEFQVNAELAPFLVSSTRSVQWVSNTSQTGTIRAAVRKRQNLESEIVSAVVRLGLEAEWGNVHELTTEGVQRCVDHVASYDLSPLEILVAPDTDLTGIEMPAGVTANHAPWVPLDAVVVVPVDRGFVGTIGTIGKHKAVAVVHNAARSIAVAARLGIEEPEQPSEATS